MEKRLNHKINEYITHFKEDIKEKAVQLGLTKYENMNHFIQYIYDYERFQFMKEDLTKRKRIKNVIPYMERCCAKRSNGEQCTRKKKEGFEYCGTHTKGIPHGVVDDNDGLGECGLKGGGCGSGGGGGGGIHGDDGDFHSAKTQRIEVWAQDIQGIMYYIDKNGNVYQTEDIVMNMMNPKIIAKYVRTGDQYKIPEFGL